VKYVAAAPLFRRVALLAQLADSELQAVVSKCVVCRLSKGKQILSAKDDTKDLFFILEGRAQVKNYSRYGRELIYSEIGSGGLFGEFAAIDGMPRAADVWALEDTIVARLGSADLLSLMREHFVLALELLKLLTAKSRALSDGLMQRIVLSAHNRMHIELARLAVDGQHDGPSAIIRPAPTHYEIAARVGSHREAVTKELNRLEAQGYVQLGRGQIVIVDEQRFRNDLVDAVLV
jgi:CRP-like cAMP-binding protein